MSISEDYQTLIDKIKSIDNSKVIKYINIPVAIYSQEAENLYNWCLQDKKKLEQVGLNWKLVESIPKRAGALRHAEAIWIKQKSEKKRASGELKKKLPTLLNLRSKLLTNFRFAFRNDEIILGRIKAITKGQSYASKFQDLNDLSVLGKKHIKELKAINFDMDLLDQAVELARELSSLLSETKVEEADNEAKLIRNKAYTYLKRAVDEVNTYGKFIHHHNKERQKGYFSAYLRRARTRYKKKEKDTINNKDKQKI